ncbi:hypothetical protein [Amycolatopsis sp. H20-H5]|uniref:hypothetical protein n=1 Tax=Amycolatopsis sp. H20-H5 TaxID=3046309 RepID=UPI002DB81342|nr:hypothetical protein [Amycolatopsis sp. H20-H5]MEC3981613.1 hypothetical protein [Amycolatopsis sp. H20-H5]
MRKTTLATCASMLVLATLTGCDPGGAADDPGRSSRTDGAGQPGAEVRTVSDLFGLVSGEVGQRNTTHVELRMAGPVGTTTGKGQLKFDKPVAMQMTMSDPRGGADTEMELVDNIVYLKIPQLRQFASKPWFKIDPNGTDPLSKTFGAMISMSDQYSDPTKQLDQLKSAGTLTGVTEEQVNGEQTTHYAITVDVRKMADSVTDPTAKQLVLAAAAQGIDHYPVDMWVNSAHLPVKEVIDMPAAAGRQTTTVNYSDWGGPVDIQAPPADQIGTIPTP